MTTATLPDDLATPELAIKGGAPVNPDGDRGADIFHWPIVTQEDEQAVLEVLRAGTMSQTPITHQFENEFAQWIGRQYALAYPNGTMSLLAAMWAVGIQRGDEIICPSLTYWASALPVLSLGASVVFADNDPDTLCIDPEKIEQHISPRTKAIVAVHYCGHPAEMDKILTIAQKHNLKVIEDVSHAHGALYQGQKVGTFGDVAAMSMMGGKSFAIGEGGMLVTDDQEIYERAIAFSHYERHANDLTIAEIKNQVISDAVPTGMPLGGVKGRMNQTCAAMGRVQLKYYPARIAEIQKALNYFWDLLEGVPGLKAHRPAKDSGSTMGGWYNPVGIYNPDELGGLPVEKFIEAVNAEGGQTGRGTNFPLHLHPIFNSADIYGDGKPTRNAFSDRDLCQREGSLPNAEATAAHAFGIPWFKHYDSKIIESYAAAYKKVALQAEKI